MLSGVWIITLFLFYFFHSPSILHNFFISICQTTELAAFYRKWPD